MKKKFITLGIAFLMLFSLAACLPEDDEMSIQLKQGFYNTDDNVYSIRLYDENQFSFHISYISHLPTGTYRVENGKLMLKYSESDELVFEIINDELVFIGTNKDGVFMEEGLVKAGTVFKKSFVEVETDSMVDGSKFLYSDAISWIGNPIWLNHADEKTTFECVVDNGTFIVAGSPTQYVKSIEVKPNEGFHWQPYETKGDEDFNHESRAKNAFVEIILRDRENIVGYALVEIYPADEQGLGFRARCIKSALFPLLNGNGQLITENQVKTIFENIKGEITL